MSSVSTYTKELDWREACVSPELGGILGLEVLAVRRTLFGEYLNESSCSRRPGKLNVWLQISYMTANKNLGA